MATDTDRIIKIINAVKKRECLWNVHYADYAKRDKLEKAWKEVSEETGKSDTFCREKWRNVRTGFLRSMQNNYRIVQADDCNDFQAVRRKRFYLFEQMKFLLPSAEVLEQARKRRKCSGRSLKNGEELHEYNNDSNMHGYSAIGKYETKMEKETHQKDAHHHGRQLENKDTEQEVEIDDSNYEQLLREWEQNLASAKEGSTETTLDESNNENLLEEQQTKTAEVVNNHIQMQVARLESNQKESSDQEVETQYKTDNTLAITDYNERTANQLLDFFRGNIDDIMTLSKRKQRIFKRKMLELIEALHNDEDD